MDINHPSQTAPRLINEERDLAIAAGFDWDSVKYDTDEKSLFLINSRVTKILAKRALGMPAQDLQWRASDDTMHTFTEDEFLTFAIAIDEAVEVIYGTSWVKKSQL